MRSVPQVLDLGLRGLLRTPQGLGDAKRRPTLVFGQVEWTAAGTYLWQVPPGVYSISGVAIGTGQTGIGSSPFTGGGGGGLHWRNSIPVTPGEWLTIVISVNNIAAVEDTTLKRGAQILLLGGRGQLGGGGGLIGGITPVYDVYGGGGGRGGGSGGGDGNGGLGGGAGGYMGDGGQGGNFVSGAGQMPVLNSGGGRGGDNGGAGTGYSNSVGEGVGLHGRTQDYAPGSSGLIKCGGGGFGGGGNGMVGGLRLIWGRGRSYPDLAKDI